MDRCQRVPHLRLQSGGGGVSGEADRTGSRQVDLDHARDRSGSRRHDRDPIRQAHRLRHRMRHQDHGARPLQPERLQLGVERLAAQCVECRERLVQQQHRRVADQRAGQAGALRHAAGQLPRPQVGGIGQANPRQRLAGARASFIRRHAPAAPAAGPRCRASTATAAGAAAGRRCPTRPSPACGALPVVRPRSCTRPASGRSRPAISRSSVDLPQPLGPITTVKLPAGTSSEHPSSATSAPPRAGKLTVASSTRTAWPAARGLWCVAMHAPDGSNHRRRGMPRDRRSIGHIGSAAGSAQAQPKPRTMRRRNASRSPSPFRTVTVGPVCR